MVRFVSKADVRKSGRSSASSVALAEGTAVHPNG
jgi:hypothetical protein